MYNFKMDNIEKIELNLSVVNIENDITTNIMV